MLFEPFLNFTNGMWIDREASAGGYGVWRRFAGRRFETWNM